VQERKGGIKGRKKEGKDGIAPYFLLLIYAPGSAVAKQPLKFASTSPLAAADVKRRRSVEKMHLSSWIAKHKNYSGLT